MTMAIRGTAIDASKVLSTSLPGGTSVSTKERNTKSGSVLELTATVLGITFGSRRGFIARQRQN